MKSILRKIDSLKKMVTQKGMNAERLLKIEKELDAIMFYQELVNKAIVLSKNLNNHLLSQKAKDQVFKKLQKIVNQCVELNR